MNIFFDHQTAFIARSENPKVKQAKSYPAFGQVIVETPQQKWGHAVDKVIKIALILFSITTFCFAIGRRFGAVLGFSTVITSLAIKATIQKIIGSVYAYRYQLELPSESFFDPKIPLLGEYVETNLRVSNNAAESFEWKKQLIESAKESIELSGNFAGGEFFREVLKLIEQKVALNPNLKVHLLLSQDLLESQDIEMLKRLAENPNFQYLITGRIYTFEPFFHSQENHFKLLTVDEKYFVIGGTGLYHKMAREVYIPNPKKREAFLDSLMDQTYRDTDLIGEGKIASLMRQQFFRLYQKWETRAGKSNINRFFLVKGNKGTCQPFHLAQGLVKNAKMKFIVSGPEHRLNNPISSEYVKRIRKAKKVINIANFNFNPSDDIKKALQEKKKEREIKISAHLNGTEANPKFFHYLNAWQSRSNYHLVDKVYEHEVKEQIYHKKVATFDDLYAIVGTYNLSLKSAHCDDESICVVKNEAMVHQIKEGLSIDAKHSKELDGDKLKSYYDDSFLKGRLVTLLFGTLF